MDRLGFLIVGIVFILCGVNVLFVPDYLIPYWGHTYGPYPTIIGVLFIIAGALFVYIGIKNIRKGKKAHN
jgi:threonine/homoserine/homoserine lactone efflux protein